LQNPLPRDGVDGEVEPQLVPPASRRERSLAAWQWLLSLERCQQANLLAADGFVAADRSNPHANVESQFVRMLAEFLDWDSDDAEVALAVAVSAALRCRDAAEQAAFPTNPRTQYWIRFHVDVADQTRRLAEDHLYVGTRELTDQATRTLQRLATEPEGNADQRTYHAAANLATRVSRAFALRNRALAELPWLLNWQVDASGTVADTRVRDRIQKLLEDLAVLTDQLETVESPTRLNEIQDALDTLAADIRDRGRRLRHALTEVAARDSVAISRLLETPLISGRERNNLRSHLMDWLSESHAELTIETAPTDPAASTLESVAADSAVSRHGRHPLLIHLDELASPVGATGTIGDEWSDDEQKNNMERTGQPRHARDVVSQGEQFRRNIRGLHTLIGRRTAVGIADLRKSTAQWTDTAHRELVTADRLTRIIAPLSPPAPTAVRRPGSDDAAMLLMKLDLRNLYFWHARRALDDFWGPNPDGLTNDAIESRPWFHHAATALTELGVVLLPGRYQASTVFRDTDLISLTAERIRIGQSSFLRPVIDDE